MIHKKPISTLFYSETLKRKTKIDSNCLNLTKISSDFEIVSIFKSEPRKNHLQTTQKPTHSRLT